MQETLIKAYRHWPRVKRADNPDAYVRGILLNEVRDRWRLPEKPSRSWVPRTAAMVTLVNNPVIPAGFTEVPVGN